MKKLIICIFFFTSILSADVVIPAGNVSGIWTQANSPYFIDGEITLQLSDQLIVRPGVDVIFNGYYKFIIHGRLIAPGTQADSILFTIADTTGFSNFNTNDGAWQGLRFMSTNYNGQPNSMLNRCRVEYCKSSDYYATYADRCGGGIYVNLSSNLEITNCEISNNRAGYGGGIFIWSASPEILGCSIINNFAYSDGGGMMISGANTNPTIENSVISTNSCYYSGGGVFCSGSSSPVFNNVTINGNNAERGGGISSWGANPILYNVIIMENEADWGYGGGIECIENSNMSITNGMISNNIGEHGGGIFNAANLNLSGVTICHNVSEYYGGGIYFYEISETLFDPDNRCNIYLNSCTDYNIGQDLAADSNLNIEVIVDTFTVLYPNNKYAHPIASFSFDIQNFKQEQVFADLYVSPSGSNENSGLTPHEPLQTVSYALSIIAASSTEPHTIYLANGTYSPLHTGEVFPLQCESYITISGEDRDFTILNALGSNRVINCSYSNTSIKNMSVINGHANDGGGICISAQNCFLSNLKIINNSASDDGGGIYCYGNDMICEDIIVSNNSASDNGGGIYINYASPAIINSMIVNNNSGSEGGGLYIYNSNLSVSKTLIADNNSYNMGGGGLYTRYSEVNAVNVTFANNYSYSGGGSIYSYGSETNLISSISWNNFPPEILFQSNGTENFFSSSFSDIMGGESGIITNNNGIVNWFDGNIEEDPLFADSLSGDFHLTEYSPCINTGSPYQLPDPDGTRSDMGAYYFPNTGGNGQVWANFEADPTDLIMTFPVNFYDNSLGFNTTITSWQWDFESDGIIDSYDVNPVHCYPDTGHYSVSLTVEDNLGNSNTMLKENYITVHAPEYFAHLWNIHPEGSDELGNGSIEYPFATIQHGILESTQSDTVLVHPGTYVENVNFMGRAIILGSLFYTTQDSSYISQTVIDGNNNGHVVYVAGGLDSTVVICGFTIRNGSESGIRCNHGSPQILNCIITQNDGIAGGGICLEDSQAILSNLIISENHSSGNGGGIFVCSPGVKMTDILIIDNMAAINGGGIYCDEFTPIFENVIIRSNSTQENGGGIFFENCHTNLNGVEISSNTAEIGGGGIFLGNSELEISNLTVSNNSAASGGGIFSNSSNTGLISSIFWNNSPQEIEFAAEGTENFCTIYFSDIAGDEAGIVTNENGLVYWLEGNINIDPLFVDLLNDDFHLTEDSPCIDAGNPFQFIDPDSTRADMGRYYFHHLVGNQEVWANFEADSTNAHMLLPTTFFDTSVAFFTEITIWQWDFENDGIIDSYEQNPIHIYQEIGYYSVSLTVEDAIGNSNTMTKIDYITVHAPIYNGHVWNIFPDGSDEIGNGSLAYPFATIQHGIDVAANNDTVLVHPGTYLENILVNDKNLIVGSLYYTTQDTIFISQTVIDGNANGPVVKFENDEEAISTLCGFTITNGSESGIECSNASPIICNNLITQNSSSLSGAGILIRELSDPIMYNIEISGNTSESCGGGIMVSTYSNPRMHNVTIANNTSGTMGGGLMCYLYSNPIIVNAIIWDNYPDGVFAYSDSMVIAYSDVQDGYEGEGNIEADPLFADPENGDFHLTTYSPCVDEGTAYFEWNDEVIVDLNEEEYLGSAPEMGAYEDEFLSSGTNIPNVPLNFDLQQNFPNPFNPETKIKFSIPIDSKVELEIFNIKGQKVKQLFRDQLSAGQHSITWNGTDETGKQTSSGIYFYKVRASVNGKTKFEKIRKMMLLK